MSCGCVVHRPAAVQANWKYVFSDVTFNVTFNEVHGFIKQYLMREQNQKKCYGCVGQPLSQQIENMFSPIRVPETPYIVRSLSVDVENIHRKTPNRTSLDAGFPSWWGGNMRIGLEAWTLWEIWGWSKRLGHCEAGWNKDGRRHCEGNIHCQQTPSPSNLISSFLWRYHHNIIIIFSFHSHSI